jgi:hypothetical protein
MRSSPSRAAGLGLRKRGTTWLVRNIRVKWALFHVLSPDLTRQAGEVRVLPQVGVHVASLKLTSLGLAGPEASWAQGHTEAPELTLTTW